MYQLIIRQHSLPSDHHSNNWSVVGDPYFETMATTLSLAQLKKDRADPCQVSQSLQWELEATEVGAEDRDFTSPFRTSCASVPWVLLPAVQGV